MASKNKFTLVLGSQSPRRKELLKSVDLNFTQMSADIEEHSNETNAWDYAVEIARQKAQALWPACEKFENPILVTSDTVVVLDNKFYGKPSSKEDARRMLSELSGKTHQVVTSVIMWAKEDEQMSEHHFCSQTNVEFEKISDEIMELYLQHDECMDKAGAYGIQARGLMFVKAIEGSYSNVVGFPLNEFIKELKSFLDQLGYPKTKPLIEAF